MEKRKKWPVFGPAPVTFLLVVIMLFADFFGGDIIPFDRWMQQFSSSQVEEEKPPQSPFARLVRGKDRRKLETTGFACDVAENSIVCLADHPVRIDTNNNITVYYSSSHRVQGETSVKPYALQKDKYLLQYITPVRILHSDNQPPVCQYNHEVPAVIFSSGISRNVFHEFNDILIPLFITTKHFQSRVLIILEDYDPSFVAKYSKIFSRMSSYEVMNPAANRSVHCFPGMILGLKYHDNLALNPSDIPGGYSIDDFRQFIGETYSLKFKHVSQIRKPTLMLISREKTRKILNEDEMITMMKELGFRVIVATAEEARNVNKFANTVNSCSVLVGAHGAGLTNELFLPAGAVMVQVEPLGLEWAAANYYGNPAPTMHLYYLRYKIELEESSLVELYGRHHSVITDPESVYAKGYREVKAVYLDQQDVRVNIVRFRKTMLQALELVKNAPLTR
ncbi:UNVERIFIED_CONTAM: Alpha-1,3-arabinosyltransferase XAT3 [Sesamum latifolium]|uniref:Alpha-1,3-arabinosyltransferase XAT3 n=1 Tax=Sesamum latifolium TaxID=2727402 RepID=A0AAW2WP95_9LAMI